MGSRWLAGRWPGGGSRSVLAVLVVLIGAAVLCPWTPAAAATGRYALVIGNNAYKAIGPLQNAVQDSEAIAAEFKRAGFEVRTLTNVDRRTFISEVIALAQRAEGGGEAAFFYAGHGIQIGATNYLLPVDFSAVDQSMVPYDAISLTEVSNHLLDAKTRFSLLIIDACRNNPLPKTGTRMIGMERGLAPMSPATGQLVVYSAGNGQTALDGLGPGDRDRNSVFVREFIKQMRRPGVSIKEAIEEVRDSVEKLAQTVNHAQRPAVYDESKGRFYFHPAIAKAADPVPAQPPSGAQVPVGELTVELAFWDAIKNATQVGDYEAYLKQYPNGRFSELVKARLKTLGAPVAAAAPAPSAQNLRQSAAPIAFPIVLPDPKAGDRWKYHYLDLATNVVSDEREAVVQDVSENAIKMQWTSREGKTATETFDRQWGRTWQVSGQVQHSRPYDFPMTDGKTWNVSWLYEKKEPNGAISNGKTEMTFRVSGIEKVTVPAGTFDTVKIVGQGKWTNYTRGSTGTNDQTTWYSPAARRVVQFEEKSMVLTPNQRVEYVRGQRLLTYSVKN